MINYRTKTFPNGLRLLTSPLASTEAVTILILVEVGGRYEAKEKNGLSHFLEHLFFKGSQKYPSIQAIAKELDALGANYNAFTGEEHTGFYVQSDSRDFKKSLDILSDMFLNPLFPESEVEKEKGVILEEANMYRDVPQMHVSVLSQAQMFPNSPLGWNLVGTPESVKNISRGDIANYFQAGYTPSTTTVVICGNPKNFDWEKEIEACFKNKVNGPGLKYKPAESAKIEKVVAEKRKTDQTHFILAAKTFPKTDPRRYALILLSTILGGGMSSRLFSKIRAQRGWAYYVKSSLAPFTDTGLIAFSAGVKNDKLADSVQIILEELEDIKQNGPVKDELERAKSNLRGQLALSLEDSFEIASFLGEEALYEPEIRQVEEIIDNLNKVSEDEIKKTSQEIFKSDKMGLAVVGPEKYKVDIK